MGIKWASAAAAICAAMVITACGSTAQEPAAGNETHPAASVQEETALQRIVQVTDSQGTTVRLHLNDSPAAGDLYAQLPLTIEVQNYSTNEKIFYPPQKLNTDNTPMAAPRAGMVAYYEPWGDVVLFYDELNGSPLYELGEVEEGPEQIARLSGTLQIEKAGN